MWINTLIQVYQFSDVVDGKRPLLVVRAPLSPVCPTNGNGTAIGYSEIGAAGAQSVPADIERRDRRSVEPVGTPACVTPFCFQVCPSGAT